MASGPQRLADADFQALERNGFQLVADFIDDDGIEFIRSAIEIANDGETLRRRSGEAFAVRNLLTAAPLLKSFVESKAIRHLVETALSPNAFLVRSILFDKVPGANWKVPWHQDTAIPVKKRVGAAGFGPWSTKAGVTHVRPPADVLERMLTLRVHLDPCDSTNGALIVLAGSHLIGRIDESEIGNYVASHVPHVCEADAGSVLLMKPLLLHSSRPATNPSRRRIVHLEFACDPLPYGIEWHTDDAMIDVVL